MLFNIFQILRPVGVYLIGGSSIPTFRSFGPLPRDSSEGFLVSFTPRLLESVAEKSFFAILSASLVFHAERHVYPRSRPSSITFSQEGSGGTRLRQEWQYCQARKQAGGLIRNDLMTPATILEPRFIGIPRTQLMRPFGKGRKTSKMVDKAPVFGKPSLTGYIEEYNKIASRKYQRRKLEVQTEMSTEKVFNFTAFKKVKRRESLRNNLYAI